MPIVLFFIVLPAALGFLAFMHCLAFALPFIRAGLSERAWIALAIGLLLLALGLVAIAVAIIGIRANLADPWINASL